MKTFNRVFAFLLIVLAMTKGFAAQQLQIHCDTSKFVKATMFQQVVFTFLPLEFL